MNFGTNDTCIKVGVHKIREISIDEIMQSVLRTFRRSGVKDLGDYCMEVTKVIVQAKGKQLNEIDMKRRLMAIPRNDLVMRDRTKFEKAIEILAKNYSDPSITIMGAITPSQLIPHRIKIPKKEQILTQEKETTKTRPNYLYVCYIVFLGILAGTVSEILGSWIIIGGLYGQLIWLTVAVLAAIILGLIEHSK